MAKIRPETMQRLNDLVNSDKFSSLKPETQNRIRSFLGSETPEISDQRTNINPTGVTLQGPRTNLLTDPIGTLQRSGGEFVGGIVEAASQPIETAKSIGRLGLGVIQKAIPGRQKEEAVADQLGEFLKQRYGSIEAAKQTALEDPVGFAADLSIVFGGVGGTVGAIGKTAKAGKVARAGQTISRVGQAIDPLGAPLRAAGQTLKSATKGRKIAPFGKKIDPEVVSAAQNLGIDLPASATTRSRAVPIIEATVAKGAFGGKLVKKIDAANDALVNTADDLIKKTGQTSDLGTAGATIFDGAEKFRQRFFDLKDKLYEKALFNKRGKDIVFDPKTSLDFIDNILEEKIRAEKLLGGSEDIRFFRNLKSKLQKEKVNIVDVRATIKELNQKLRNVNDPVATGSKAQLKKLVTMLSDDFDNVIAAQDPSLAQDLNRANRFFKLSLEEINSNFGKTIFKFKDQPDKIIPSIFSKSASADDVKRIYRLAGQENVPAIQAAFLENLFNKAKSVDGNFTPGGIARQMKSFGDVKLSNILSAEQFQTLKDLSTTSRSLGRLSKITGGSQTAFSGRLAGELAAFVVNPQAAAPFILSDVLGSKAVSSKLGQRLLSEGVTLKGGVGQRVIDTSRRTANVGRFLRTGDILRDRQDQ